VCCHNVFLLLFLISTKLQKACISATAPSDKLLEEEVPTPIPIGVAFRIP
jgi:hypothetical protein